MIQLPAALARGNAWRTYASCREADPDLFFPAGDTGQSAYQAEEAKAICRTCPVMATCLQRALETNQQGVWGGTTERERANIRRRKARSNAPAAAQPRRITMPTTPGPVSPLRAAFDARTVVTEDGHIEWTGPRSISVHSRCYSPNQLSWLLSYDLPPVGNIMRDCDHLQCVAHLVDQAGRDERKAQEREAAVEASAELISA